MDPSCGSMSASAEALSFDKRSDSKVFAKKVGRVPSRQGWGDGGLGSEVYGLKLLRVGALQGQSEVDVLSLRVPLRASYRIGRV